MKRSWDCQSFFFRSTRHVLRSFFCVESFSVCGALGRCGFPGPQARCRCAPVHNCTFHQRTLSSCEAATTVLTAATDQDEEPLTNFHNLLCSSLCCLHFLSLQEKAAGDVMELFKAQRIKIFSALKRSTPARPKEHDGNPINEPNPSPHVERLASMRPNLHTHDCPLAAASHVSSLFLCGESRQSRKRKRQLRNPWNDRSGNSLTKLSGTAQFCAATTNTTLKTPWPQLGSQTSRAPAAGAAAASSEAAVARP